MTYDLSKFISEATKPGKSLSIYEEKYNSYPLILYSINELLEQERKKTKTDTDKIELPELTEKQISFIEMLDTVEEIPTGNEESTPKNININTACARLGIRKTELIIWIKTNLLFEKCYQIIKEAEAEQAESILWSGASNAENKDSLSRMFAIKARKQEYRENAQPQVETVVNVHVKIDDSDFDVNAGFKNAGSD